MSDDKKKKEPVEKEQPQSQPVEAPKPPARVPLLIDFALSVTKMAVVLIGAVTAVLSILAGATVEMTVLRSGAAMLAIGLMFWLVNWWIAQHSLEAVRQELLEQVEGITDDPVQSTLEKAA